MNLHPIRGTFFKLPLWSLTSTIINKTSFPVIMHSKIKNDQFFPSSHFRGLYSELNRSNSSWWFLERWKQQQGRYLWSLQLLIYHFHDEINKLTGWESVLCRDCLELEAWGLSRWSNAVLCLNGNLWYFVPCQNLSCLTPFLHPIKKGEVSLW